MYKMYIMCNLKYQTNGHYDLSRRVCYLHRCYGDPTVDQHGPNEGFHSSLMSKCHHCI